MITVLSQGCASFSGSRFSGYENRRIVIQYAPMFTQKNTKIGEEKYNWAGDWVFRRKRLALLDKQISSVKPDIILFQDLVYREYSPSESEFYILSAGATEDYSWHISKTDEISISEESVASAAAMALPIKVDLLKSLSRKESWDLGNGSYIVVTRFKTEQGDAVLMSIKLLEDDNGEIPYQMMANIVEEVISSTGVCRERFILSGEIPEDRISYLDQGIIEKLGFKDVAYDFCDELESCYTESIDNKLFSISNPNSINGRSSRILVHEKTKVLASLRNLENKISLGKEEDRYGLGSISANHRYGWLSTINLAICD
jgi:hypothetical protein